MQFINTRPTSRAEPLSQFLHQHGIKVTNLPLLELSERPLDAVEKSILQAINNYQLIIMVSEEAIRYGLATLAKLVRLDALSKQISWLAVGEKTANYFVQTWQQFTDCSPPTVIFPNNKLEQNNEGLVKLPNVQTLKKSDEVQIWRGIGGRELLANTLSAKGIDVQLINFYQRILPNATVEKFTILQNQFSKNEQKFVLISSLKAWQHWQQLLADSSLNIDDFEYLVLQNRIATMMQTDINNQKNKDLGQFDNILIINDLNPQTILNAITNRS